MKYSNAHNILPVDIVKIIQEYVDGEYLYIPRKEEEQKKLCSKLMRNSLRYTSYIYYFFI